MTVNVRDSMGREEDLTFDINEMLSGLADAWYFRHNEAMTGDYQSSLEGYASYDIFNSDKVTSVRCVKPTHTTNQINTADFDDSIGIKDGSIVIVTVPPSYSVDIDDGGF